jgi:hypothetical protein
MGRLALILLLSSLGGTIILHSLKDFFLEEKIKFRPDWDGLLERVVITCIIVAFPARWLIIPVVIALKSLFRLFLLGYLPGIGRTTEPGAAAQKVLLKSELAFDLLLSPAFAILVGFIFK